MPTSALTVDQLFRRCDPDQFDFSDTTEIAEDRFVMGQERAEEALAFGIRMSHAGYNVFVLGESGTGRRALVNAFLDRAAAERAAPDDWCYVNNFDDPTQPLALCLPAGRGAALRDDVELFVDDVLAALHAAFESEEYQLQRQAVQEAAREKEEEALKDLQQRAREENIAVMRTPTGFAFAPIREGQIVSAQDMTGIADADRTAMETAVERFQEELQGILRLLPRRVREMREQLRELNREVADFAIADRVRALKEPFADLDDVTAYLDALIEDLLATMEEVFLHQGEEDAPRGVPPLDEAIEERSYRVNLVVDHGETSGAPIVHVDNPNYANLVGEIEQIAQMGTLVTDFNLIKPGALHRANGGYLVVEARKLLSESFAWEGLKRALYNGQIRIESPSKALGLMSTVTVEPEPVPLNVKVILIGEPFLYYLLQANDPDFAELFKVMADFDDQVDRGGDNTLEYAHMLASLARRENVRPLNPSGVARLIEQSARIAGDSEKLSTHLQVVTDLLREADFAAGQAQQDVIGAAHVQQAIDAQTRRSDRIRERMYEQILRDTVHIRTDGAEIGQINGLAVLQIGGFAFGKPSRITAQIRVGRGEVVDIEREVDLGGPLHSKGMLILSSFLGARYAPHRPLSLSASLVFEQSYGGVDGDSASSTELYALLSAIAEVPIRQQFAVTGSVDQKGRVQPIGGANEKIEGFFDICRARGLSGNQGVLVPAANIRHLMLRRDVVDAAASGEFHIFAVDHIDEGIEILTGLPAGTMDDDGVFADGSFNRIVTDKLAALTERRLQFAREARHDDV